MNRYYALYKGDEIITIGTKKDLAIYLNVKESTIEYYSTSWYHNKIKYNNLKNRMYCIKIEEEDFENEKDI